MKPLIIFNHGKESGPNGTKIRALSEIALNMQFEFISVDYQGMLEPQPRIDKLIKIIKAETRPVILVGSSMGSYVAIVASQVVDVVGLFLMAPAVYMPTYEHQIFTPRAKKILLIHGWYDPIVPVANVIRFGKNHHVPTLLLNDDHVLSQSLERLCVEFKEFLTSITKLDT